MQSCGYPVEKLLVFLEKKLSGEQVEMTTELQKHIAKCSACREIVENTQKAKAFIKYCRTIAKITSAARPPSPTGHVGKFGAGLAAASGVGIVATKSFDLLSIAGNILALKKSMSSRSSKPEPWQLWKITGSDSKKTIFGVVVSIKSFLNKHFEIVPVFINYKETETADDDILIPPDSNSLYLPLLLEYWNKCCVKSSSQFVEYHGSLSSADSNRLKESLRKSIKSVSSETVNFFRNKEIELVKSILK